MLITLFLKGINVPKSRIIHMVGVSRMRKLREHLFQVRPPNFSRGGG